MSETETGTDSLAEIGREVARARAELAASDNFVRDAQRQDAAMRHVAAASEAAITVARAVIDKRGLHAGEGGRANFRVLEEAGLISSGMRAQLASLAGFRNLATRQCSPTDMMMVESVIRNELGALTEFADLARRL